MCVSFSSSVILFVLQFTAEVVYNVCKMVVCVVKELSS
jgi:hypothetical protein